MKVKRIIAGIVITLIVGAAAVFGVFFFRNKSEIIFQRIVEQKNCSGDFIKIV